MDETSEEKNQPSVATLSRGKIIPIVVGAWIVFSAAYMGYDIWSDFKASELQSAFRKGRADAVRQLIARAEKCQPFDVQIDEDSVTLINTACLQRPRAGGSPPMSPPVPSPARPRPPERSPR